MKKTRKKLVLDDNSKKIKRKLKLLYEAEQEMKKQKEVIDSIREELFSEMKTGQKVSVKMWDGVEKIFSKIKRIDYSISPEVAKEHLTRKEIMQCSKIMIGSLKELKGEDFIKEHGEKSKIVYVGWVSKEREG